VEEAFILEYACNDLDGEEVAWIPPERGENSNESIIAEDCEMTSYAIKSTFLIESTLKRRCGFRVDLGHGNVAAVVRYVNTIIEWGIQFQKCRTNHILLTTPRANFG
jgi:hypothetical protein